MKKSLIALAALATVGAAQAQSSVTVYGTYDVGYQGISSENVGGVTGAATQVKTSGLSGSALTSNRFGLRGTEDLGGGLRANFNLEYGFANNLAGDTVSTTTAAASGQSSIFSGNGGALNTRTSRVGLESAKLGRLDLGYGLTGLFATITGHSPLPGNNWVGDVAYTDTTASSADSRILLDAVRANGVQYTSPSVNGLQAVVDWGVGSNKRESDAAGADSRVSNAGLTVRYNAGKLALAATTHTLKRDYAVASNAITSTEYQAISARYSLASNLSLNALYAKNKSKDTAGAQSAKNDVIQVGAAYTMGKTVLVAQYGEGEGEGTSATNQQRDRKGYQVGAIHNLSKRTNVYAVYGMQDQKYVTGTSAGNTEKVSGIAAGVRHSF